MKRTIPIDWEDSEGWNDSPRIKPKAVVFVLQNPANGDVLMEWRDDGIFSPGHWVFPGGKIEDGEAISEALDREMTEELGCRPELGKRLSPIESKRFGIQPYVIWEWEGSVPKQTLDAGAYLAWVTVDDARRSTWASAAAIAHQVKVLEISNPDPVLESMCAGALTPAWPAS